MNPQMIEKGRKIGTGGIKSSRKLIRISPALLREMISSN